MDCIGIVIKGKSNYNEIHEEKFNKSLKPTGSAVGSLFKSGLPAAQICYYLLYRRTIMKRYAENKAVDRIEKRKIEALAIAPLIEKISTKIGKDEALEMLKEVNQQEAFKRGQNTVRTKDLNAIEELVRDVATWGEGGIWEMEVLEQTSTSYFFNVHRCPYYEKYKEVGLEKFGVQFSCCRDEPFARGLDHKLRLSRSQTIMEGAEFCDFRYYLDP
jgi:hypothetical protein